jgi:hypothetical protein
MFRNLMLVFAVLCGGLLASAGQAMALTTGWIFVGSWTPNSIDAPVWTEGRGLGPLAYTGQEAAALLFGGLASDYAISTDSDDPMMINHMAWYDVIGAGGYSFAEDYSKKYLGHYYGPTTGFNCCGDIVAQDNAASAFVRDNGVFGINYAFRLGSVSPVPLPAALPLLLMAIAGLAAVRKRRS